MSLYKHRKSVENSVYKFRVTRLRFIRKQNENPSSRRLHARSSRCCHGCSQSGGRRERLTSSRIECCGKRCRHARCFLYLWRLGLLCPLSGRGQKGWKMHKGYLHLLQLDLT